MSLLTYADQVSVDGDTVKIVRHNGGVETLEAKLPAVCSVTEKANAPRSATIRGKMNAKKAVFTEKFVPVCGKSLLKRTRYDCPSLDEALSDEEFSFMSAQD